jgi:hypothetical protein
VSKKEGNKSFWELWNLSKIAYNEAFLEGYLANLGNRKEKFIKRFKENKANVSRNAWLYKILASVFFISMDFFLVIFVIFNFKDNLSSINEANFGGYLFAVSLLISILFSIKLLYFFAYSITNMTGIFSGKAHRLLETLPLNNKEIRRITLFMFIRSSDLQLIVLFLGFPILSIIFTGSLFTGMVAFLVSGVNIIYSISIVAFLCYIMSKKIFTNQKSRGKTLIRFIVTIAYVLVLISMSLIISVLINWIPVFVAQASGLENFWTVNNILSFAIYPFSLSYLYGISLFPLNLIYLQQIWIPLIGFIVSVIVAILVFKLTLKILYSTTKEEEFQVRKTHEVKIDYKLKKSSPAMSILKKDLFYILRTFSASMFMFMPILFPILGSIQVLTFSGTIFETLFFGNIMILMYIGASLFMVLMAATTSEAETGGLIFTLPLKQSTIFKGKKLFMLLIMYISLLISFIVLIFILPTQILYISFITVSLALTYFYSIDLTLILYALFVGKTGNIYTLYNLNPRNKVIKAIVGTAIVYAVAFTPVLVSILITTLFPIIEIVSFIIPIIIEAIILVILRLVARRMFNPTKK